MADSHQLEDTSSVIQLDWVVCEPAGDVALPVEDAHCHHCPHQHGAVAECRPCPVERLFERGKVDSTWQGGRVASKQLDGRRATDLWRGPALLSP